MDGRLQQVTKLSHSQQQIWIGQRLHPRSPLYNMAFAWVFDAELRADLFEAAWRRVLEKNPVLRSVAVESGGETQLQVRDADSMLTQTLDWSQRPGAERGLASWLGERCSQPLPLDSKLVDSLLIRLPGGGTCWYLNQHHLISDAWSTVLVYRQVAAEYAALVRGEGAAESPAASQTQPAEPSLEALQTARTHWEERLRQPNRTVPLYGRNAVPSDTASTRLTIELSAERSQALARLCQETGFASLSPAVSRFAVFSTLLLSWLQRVSGQSELSFDAPAAGRDTAAKKRAIGLFIEMFPFQTELDTGETFRSLGAKCLAETALFLQHALPGLSAPSGAAAGNVVLNYFPESFGDFAEIPARVEWIHPGHGDSVHALRLQVHDFGGTGSYTLHFDFNDGVLPDELRCRGLRHFESLLDALLDNPDQEIAAVDILTEEEREELATLNGQEPQPLPDRSVVALFEERAGADPAEVALRQGDAELSLGQLWRRTNALAAALEDRGVQPGDRVAILGRRSIDVVTAILATLRARAAYVPVDPSYPARRIREILDDCGARLVLTGEGEAVEDVTGLPIADGIRAGEGRSPRADAPLLDDLAYVLYTSGSTGRPKGVLVEHAGLADYLLWASRQYVRGERLTFPLFTSLSFDLTVTSLFLPLITGGVLEVFPEPGGPVDSTLVDVVEANRADFIKLTPSHLALMSRIGLEGSRLRRMVVGGEDFKASLAARVASQVGRQLEIYNEYGPTEAIVGCMLHRYDPAADTGASVPIGKPADHVELEILNEALTPTPSGTPGELWISRYGLARGYHQLPELTAERFQPRPDRPGERRYRSGDRVRLLAPNKLDYLGRIDRQLKISGFRVESGEIEAALLTVPGVESCAVVALEPERAAGADAAEVRHCVRCGLPSNYPQAAFDKDGVCSVCRSYEAVKDHAQGYFKTMDELRAVFAASGQRNDSPYDCMMLLSGGKDSTYALCRLVDMGLRVYAFTLDNGFISDGAKRNIERVTGKLGVPVEFGVTTAMNAIFRDSLSRNSNVCHGCFKTVYTLSTTRAQQLGIPIIVTGLSRGQMFETRLTEEMFRDGRRSPEEVDAAVLAARKVYHRVDDEVSRSLDVSLFASDDVFERIQFVDFYRYCDVGLDEMLSYLREKVPWARPEDTGRSTNCLINDVGIYVHKQERGFHNYALPYSWDVRLGHKQRDEALAELDDHIDPAYVHRTLAEIGYDGESLAVAGRPRVIAFYTGPVALPEAEIRARLRERLPAPLVPSRFERGDSIPLTPHGKVDDRALAATLDRAGRQTSQSPPDGPVEEYLADTWRQLLGVTSVGRDDDFFELGGASLTAMEVMIRLCKEFQIDLPLETLFAHSRLSALARVAEDKILDDVAALE